MKMRFVHLIVVAGLVAAAVNVYTIKYESAVRAEQVAKLAAEIKHERETIAALRAEWALLDNPMRIEALARRHLALKMLDPVQIEHLDRLPERFRLHRTRRGDRHEVVSLRSRAQPQPSACRECGRPGRRGRRSGSSPVPPMWAPCIGPSSCVTA